MNYFLSFIFFFCLYILIPLVSSILFPSVLQEPCETKECILYKMMSTRILPKTPHRTGPDLIRENGYPLEQHNITASDGYITSLYRIPHGKNNSQLNVTRVPVFLHHGILADGFQWILNSVDKALAYRLADAGLDVWMTCNRGTSHSLNHSKMSWRAPSYWNYSYSDIANKDVPVIIDYILEETNRPKLYYLAHSMGCNAFFAFISLNPEYNSKIITFIGLAPSVYVGNSSLPISPLRPILLSQQSLHDDYIQGPFVHPDFLPFMQVMGVVCAPKLVSKWICFAALEAIFGYDFIDDNTYDLKTEVITIGLSSVSIKAFIHLMQLWKSGKFQAYDYLEKNVEIYGQKDPPAYDMQKVTAPVVLYCAYDDHVVTCKDTLRLSKHVPNLKEFRPIEEPHFNHIDFLFSSNVNKLLYDRILEIITRNEFGEPE